MDPFRIVCPTCQTRLKVRDKAAIGQILACPHCQSMVHVLPPGATDTAGNVAPDVIAGDPSVASAQASAQTVSSKFETIPELEPAEQTESTTRDSTATKADGQVDHSVESSVGTTTDSPSLELAASAAWTSPTERAWQSIVVWWVAGGTGLLLFGGLAALWWTQTATPPDVATNAVVVEATEPAAETDDDSANLIDDDSLAKTADTVQSENDVPIAIGDDGPGNRSQDSDDAATLPPVTTPLTSDPATSRATTPVVDGGDEAAPETTPPITDPPPIANDAPEDAATPADTEPPHNAVAENASPEIDDVVADSHLASRRHDSPNKQVRLTDDEIAARLETPLVGVEFTSLPLVELVRLVGELANVPISIDLAALEQLGLDPRTTVTIRSAETTAGEVLTRALSTIGLAHRVADQVMVVTDRRGDEHRRVNYRIDDLVDDAGAASQFADQLQRLVTPETWRAAGGSGAIDVNDRTLVVEQTPGVQFEVLAFCERVRLARGKTLRSKLPPDRFALTSPRAAAAERLSRPVTFTFDEPVRLRTVVDYLEKTTGMLVLVDWASLQSVDFVPATSISCAVDQQPLGEAMTVVLTPLDLDWVAEDADTVRIVSRADAARHREVAFYDVSKLAERGLARDAIEARLRQAAGVALNASDPMVVEWDDASGRVIVGASQPAHERIDAGLADAE